MSALPKHLRPRWRYLAVELRSWPDARIRRTQFADAIETAIRDLLGDAGAAAGDPRVFRFAFEDGRGVAVVRVPREEVGTVRAALATIATVDEQPVGIRVGGVSGTVRSCEEKYLGSQPEPTDQSQVVFDGAARPAVLAPSEVDIRVDDGFVGATPLDLE